MAYSRKLSRDIIVILLVFCAALLAPVVYLSHQAQQDISEQFIDNTASVAVAPSIRCKNGPSILEGPFLYCSC